MPAALFSETLSQNKQKQQKRNLAIATQRNVLISINTSELFFCYQNDRIARHQRLTPVILATQEIAIRRIKV
jgi:hypothetical protein